MNLQFEAYFPSHILKKGYQDYTNDAILDIEKHRNRYQAIFDDMETANIDISSHEIINLECDCDYFYEHGYCKHTAALCYAISEASSTRSSSHLTSMIASYIDELEYGYDIKQFTVFDQIMDQLQQLSLKHRFTPLITLYEAYETIDIEYDEQMDQFIEIKDLLSYGISQKEPQYLAWFHNELESPSQCEEDFIDLFYELYDAQTGVSILLEYLAQCKDHMDETIFLTMLVEELKSLRQPIGYDQKLLAHVQHHPVVLAYIASRYEEEGYLATAMIFLKDAIQAETNAYEQTALTRRYNDLSIKLKQEDICLACFQNLLLHDEQQAFMYFKKLHETYKESWITYREPYLTLLYSTSYDRKPYYLLESMKEELYCEITRSEIDLKTLVTYDSAFFPNHIEELISIYKKELAIYQAIKTTKAKEMLKKLYRHIQNLPNGKQLLKLILNV